MRDMYVVELGLLKEVSINGAPRIVPVELIIQAFLNESKALDYFKELKIYTFGKRFLKLYLITETYDGSDEFINLKIEKGGNLRNLDTFVNGYYFICKGFINN